MPVLKVSPILLSLSIGIPALSMMPINHAPADVALEQAMVSMHAAMARVHHTGNPDRDFAAMMIAHHEGAIEMAKVELQYGTDPRLRRLAQEIIVTQQSEIAVMQLALKQPKPELPIAPASK